jgi:2-polyprenyl-3-methyl-5-hydroxy-6-metoxy-1,4-benzoquinol methylase
MGLKEETLPAGKTWEKLRPVFRHHLWRHRIPLGIEELTTPGYLMMPNEWSSCFLPDSLDGKSFLDAGANDGYFSFEAERRGASAVDAIDIYRDTDFFSNTSGWSDTGIRIVRDVLDSRIQITNCSILNLQSLGKSFDFVFCNNVLAWIRDVEEAIKQLTTVCSGTLLLSDVFNNEISEHNARDKYEDNTLSLNKLKKQFELLGWEIFRIETRDEYPRMRWNYQSFDTIDSDGPVNCYEDPIDQNVCQQVALFEARALMRMNGRLFINKIGWVNESEVRLRSMHTMAWMRAYRFMRNSSGIDRMLFNLRNKQKDQGLFLFIRKKES